MAVPILTGLRQLDGITAVIPALIPFFNGRNPEPVTASYVTGSSPYR